MTSLDELLHERDPQPPKRPTRRRRRSVGTAIAGAFGELLITAGVLLGLFVVWQIWWTDVQGEQQADQAIQQFEQTLPEAPDQVAGEPEHRTGPAPEEPAPGAEEVFATMYVPAWGDDFQMPIAEGVSLADVLNNGRVGHYPETALPGQVGNFSVAGHRQTHGKPFYAINELEQGDEIIVRTAQAWYVYSVSDHLIVTPDQVGVIAPVPGDPGAEPSEAMMTLTSCHPLWSIAERYVVHAELDYWFPLEAGQPAALEGNE